MKRQRRQRRLVISKYPGSILVSAAGVFQEKAREKKQLDMTNRIKEGLASGLKVLDDAFEALEMSPEGTYVLSHVYHMTSHTCMKYMTYFPSYVCVSYDIT